MRNIRRPNALPIIRHRDLRHGADYLAFDSDDAARLTGVHSVEDEVRNDLTKQNCITKHRNLSIGGMRCYCHATFSAMAAMKRSYIPAKFRQVYAIEGCEARRSPRILSLEK